MFTTDMRKCGTRDSTAMEFFIFGLYTANILIVTCVLYAIIEYC